MRRALAFAILCAACDDEAATWSVAGGFVRDPEGRAVILRGMNVSNAHKRAPYLAHHGLADFQRIRGEYGMNAVRFLVLWAALEPRQGEFDAAYLDEVARRVSLARQAGLSVILDMHQDIYGEGFASGSGDGAPRWTCPEEHYTNFTPIEPWFLNAIDPDVVACVDRFWKTEEQLAAFTAAWRRVAQRLASEPGVVGFDLFNEPLWGSIGAEPMERDFLTPLYERVAAAVRAAAPGWIAFVEPAASRNFGLETHIAPAIANIVYAPHSYDPGAEAGGGFPPERRQAILDSVSAVALEARHLGAALWIGEYGGMPDKPGIAAYMDAQYDAAAAVLAGSMYWHDGRDNSYGTHTPEGVEKKVLIDALVRPFPERVAGEPTEWTYDDASRTLTVRYRPDREIDAPTLISVPARVYPAGWRFECGGCEARKTATQLVVDEPAGGAAATIVIRP